MKVVHNNLIEILIFILSISFYYLWRVGEPFVWDDTNLIKDYAIHFTGQKDYTFYILQAFLDETSRGYRPISNVIQFFNATTDNRIYPYAIDILIPGVMITIFNLYFYKLICLIDGNKLFSLLVIILINCNLVLLQGNWIIFAGYPILVPMLTVISIYYFSKLSNDLSIKFLLPYIFSIILGALYREVYFVVPILLITYQLFTIKNLNYKILILNFLLILNCIYPQYVASSFARIILHIIDIPEYQFDILMGKYTTLEMNSIFNMGDAGKKVSEITKLSSLFKGILYFIPIFPVTLLIIINSSIACYYFDKNYLSQKFIFFIILFVLLFMYFYYAFCVLTLFLIIVYSYVKNRVLVILWFILFLLPVLMVFTEKIHFAYSIIPFTLLLSLIVKDIYSNEFQNIK